MNKLIPLITAVAQLATGKVMKASESLLGPGRSCVNPALKAWWAERVDVLTDVFRLKHYQYKFDHLVSPLDSVSREALLIQERSVEQWATSGLSLNGIAL